jgi:hypothetical protein
MYAVGDGKRTMSENARKAQQLFAQQELRAAEAAEAAKAAGIANPVDSAKTSTSEQVKPASSSRRTRRSPRAPRTADDEAAWKADEVSYGNRVNFTV